MCKYVLSLDVSSSCVGYSIFNESKNPVELGEIELKATGVDSKRSQITKKIRELFETYSIRDVYIEEPLQNSFLTTHRTNSILGYFVGFVTGVCEMLGGTVQYVNFNSARHQCGINTSKSTITEDMRKKKNNIETKNRVREFLLKKGIETPVFTNRNGKIDKKTYDISDAAFIGYCGLNNIGVVELYRTGEKRKKKKEREHVE